VSSLRIDPDIEHRVLAGVAWFSGVNASTDNPYWPEIEALSGTLRRAHAGKLPSEIEGLEPARRLYRDFGIDPTRTRPSSEALLRRVLKGESLVPVNRLVDAGNWTSLALLLPLGLYDLDTVQGDLVLRRGAPGERFPGIRKGDVHVEGRLTVADELGAMGSPTSDSFRTRIRETTTRALAVLFAPGDFPRVSLEEGLGRLSSQVVRWCGAREEGGGLLGGASNPGGAGS
jgi:DNA/RNA-binding domain of Phe-tRNA-synthetase-like protein